MIRLVKAGFGYGGNKYIFQNLNWEINEGEVWAILGPNGSGKSTLLNCLGGVIDLKKGKIELGGMVGMVPQNFNSDLEITVLEMVVLGRARFLPWWAVPDERDYELAMSALRKVGGESLAVKKISQISGGELQLVTVARALVSEPNVLVLDEPTSALDFSNQHRVMELIVKLSKKEKLAVVFSTHHPELAMKYAQNTLMMFRGRKILAGKSTIIINSENLSELYGREIEVKETMNKHKEKTSVILG